MSVQAQLDHIGLYTKDIERSMRWYYEILGFRVSDYLPPGNTEEPVAPDGISWMRYSNLHHDMTLVQFPAEALAAPRTGRPDNLQQFAYHVDSEDAVEAAYKAVVDAGVTIASPPKRGPVLGVLQFYMADPDGNKIEIFNTPALPPRPGRSVESPGLVNVKFLSHIGIYTKDTQKSIDWYEEMLGFRVSDQRGQNPPEPALKATAPNGIAWLSNTEEHHNLVLVQLAPDEIDEPLPYGGRGTLQQIALEIESIDALLAAHEFLAAKGAKIVVPPRPQNWSGGMKFYFLDPDGVKIEISHGMKAVDLDYGSQYEIAQSIAAS
jgi:catechol 2,3-dioxygenase